MVKTSFVAQSGDLYSYFTSHLYRRILASATGKFMKTIKKHKAKINPLHLENQIRAQQGDTIIVELTNNLLTENVAIYWHGIRQKGTPWFDGTEGVTQCQIVPGTTFKYQFVVDRETVKAIRIHSHGGPEVLRWEDVPVSEPKEDEVKIKVQAVTLNPYDISVRKGEGAVLGLPLTPGWDAVGEVVEVGPGVTTLKVRDMVAHIGDPQSKLGTYAEEFILPASSAVPIPKELSGHTAGYIASVLRPGLTTIALVNCHFRQDHPNFWVLVHTVNNDIAEKLCSYLRFLGANVIATLGGPMEDLLKRNEIAQILDCLGVHVIGLNNLEEQVNRITNNNGVDVVYLSLGDDSTFKETEKCLKRTGHMVYYMHTYWDPRPAPTFSVAIIALKSIFLSIPKLDDLIPSKEKLLDSAKEVFQMVRFGVLAPSLKRKSYEMKYAAQAHSSWENGCQANPIVLHIKGTDHNNPPVCTDCTTHNRVYSLQPGGSVVRQLSEGAEAEAEAAV